jgi:hypothetical protein
MSSDLHLNLFFHLKLSKNWQVINSYRYLVLEISNSSNVLFMASSSWFLCSAEISATGFCSGATGESGGNSTFTQVGSDELKYRYIMNFIS